jgi:hypoxanthine phosphoribosyltransferase
VAVAPEGHVYGYFFERFGNSLLSVHVDYPPRRCEVLDDLGVIRSKRVLILEDDVASGTTLRHVIGALKQYRPSSIDLYLGRPKDSQVLEFVAPTINTIYLAEDHLDPNRRSDYEDQFIRFFNQK